MPTALSVPSRLHGSDRVLTAPYGAAGRKQAQAPGDDPTRIEARPIRATHASRPLDTDRGPAVPANGSHWQRDSTAVFGPLLGLSSVSAALTRSVEAAPQNVQPIFPLRSLRWSLAAGLPSAELHPSLLEALKYSRLACANRQPLLCGALVPSSRGSGASRSRSDLLGGNPGARTAGQLLPWRA